MKCTSLYKSKINHRDTENLHREHRGDIPFVYTRQPSRDAARYFQTSSGRPKSLPYTMGEHVGSPLQIWTIGNRPYDFGRGKPRPYDGRTPPFVKGGREGFNNNHKSIKQTKIW